MNAKKIILVVIIVLTTNIITFFAASTLMLEPAEKDPAPETAQQSERINEVIAILEAEHIDEVDREKLLEGAIEGLLEELDDPQASYMTPEDYENFMIQAEGTYGGIGIEVFTDNDYVTVMAPISGTPAEEIGLSSGDRIISVDGENLVGEDLNMAVSLMRGEPGTDLSFKVDRPGVDEELEFEITREKIEIDTVEYEMLENNIGYLKLNSFGQTSGQEFKDALEEMKQDGMEGLVIDLRNNPGGLLDAAVDIADLLVPEGPITHIADRDGTLETMSSNSAALGIPLVALVNESSASASEVLAGALQDTESGTIIGTKTFGKASVQNVRELSSGGALSYTVAQYKTPSERVIDEKGLSPDLEVDPPAIAELAMKPISTSLVQGDDGEEVETLQMILEETGHYDHEITGDYDQATADALKAFQEDREINVTGEMSEMVVRQFHDEIEKRRKEDDKKLERALEELLQELE